MPSKKGNFHFTGGKPKREDERWTYLNKQFHRKKTRGGGCHISFLFVCNIFILPFSWLISTDSHNNNNRDCNFIKGFLHYPIVQPSLKDIGTLCYEALWGRGSYSKVTGAVIERCCFCSPSSQLSGRFVGQEYGMDRFSDRSWDIWQSSYEGLCSNEHFELYQEPYQKLMLQLQNQCAWLEWSSAFAQIAVLQLCTCSNPGYWQDKYELYCEDFSLYRSNEYCCSNHRSYLCCWCALQTHLKTGYRGLKITYERAS